MVLHRSMVNWEEKGYISLRYICILLYVKLIWCSGVAYIYGQLEEGDRVRLPWVYVHSAIHETYLVLWCCIDLWLIRDGGWSQSAIGICAFCYI